MQFLTDCMKNYIEIVFVIILVFSVYTVYGQPPPPGDGCGGTPGCVDDVLTINFLVYPFLLLGAYIGYVFIKKSSM